MTEFDFSQIVNAKDSAELEAAFEDLWCCGLPAFPAENLDFFRDFRTSDLRIAGMVGLMLLRHGGALASDPAVRIRVFLGLEGGADLQAECARVFGKVDLARWYKECAAYFWSHDLSDTDFFYMEEFLRRYGGQALPASVEEFIRQRGI